MTAWIPRQGLFTLHYLLITYYTFGNPQVRPFIQFGFQHGLMVGKEQQEKRKREAAGNQAVLVIALILFGLVFDLCDGVLYYFVFIIVHE